MNMIILAAGNGSRFGGDKLLYLIDKIPMYCYMLEKVQAIKERCNLETVIFVSQYQDILDNIAMQYKWMIPVKNKHPEDGISHSIHLGVNKLLQVSPNAGACMFSVCDQPYMHTETLVQLVQLWENNGGIAACAYEERIGNPVIFSRNYFNDLLALRGDKGGKIIVQKNRKETSLLYVNKKELEDIDVPDIRNVYEGLAVLQDGKKHIISVVGAGGKSSLITEMAEDAAASGKKTLVMTTTHMYQPGDEHRAYCLKDVELLWAKKQYAVIGNDVSQDKLGKPDEKLLGQVLPETELTLVEADGARHMSCKVPQEHEPVIFESSDIVIGVMGMDAVGKKIEEGCFRCKEVCEMLAKKKDDLLTGEDAAYILNAKSGTRKNVEDRMYVVVLNKCDNKEIIQSAKEIGSMLNTNYWFLTKLTN